MRLPCDIQSMRSLVTLADKYAHLDEVSDHPILLLGHEMTLSRHTLEGIFNVIGGKRIERSMGSRWLGAKEKSGAPWRGGF